MFPREQSDFRGEFHEILGTARAAGREEGILVERQRVLGELALMLIGAPKPGDMHYFLGHNQALVELRAKILTPREPSAIGTELLDLAREAISEKLRSEVRGE